jgi:pimeloyl-ACP methyl ester carboxylesterase
MTEHTTATTEATAAAPRELRVEGAGAMLGLLDYGEPGGAEPPPGAGTAARGGAPAPLVAGGAPVALLLHGIRDLAWSMDSVARQLRHGYRVFSLDLRGHGASDHPGVYTFQHYGTYAGLFPERARAVVTIEGLGPPRPPGDDPSEERRAQGRAAVEMLAAPERPPRRMADLDEAAARVRANHPGLDAERARFLAARGTRALAEGGLRWSWDPRVQGTWGSTTRAATEERWSWVRCPTLVVTGGRAGGFWRGRRGMLDAEDGPMPPAELARRLARFRNARHVEIASAGHMVHFDAPDELNRAIAQFLAALAE